MELIELSGDPAIAIKVTVSSRARRLSLRISQLDGKVTMTVPRGIALQTVQNFAEEKEAWIRKHLSRQVSSLTLEYGTKVMVEGQSLTIIPADGRKVRVQDDQLLVPGVAARVGARVAGFLKVLARERLSQASDHYADKLGRRYGRITLRDTRSRWGSCSSDGNLMYSWRLVMAPKSVLDYVAAHEVAHLAEMNHSRKFWAHVDRLYPGYEVPRQWLRKNGASLHRYRFSD